VTKGGVILTVEQWASVGQHGHESHRVAEQERSPQHAHHAHLTQDALRRARVDRDSFDHDYARPCAVQEINRARRAAKELRRQSLSRRYVASRCGRVWPRPDEAAAAGGEEVLVERWASLEAGLRGREPLARTDGAFGAAGRQCKLTIASWVLGVGAPAVVVVSRLGHSSRSRTHSKPLLHMCQYND
jgi:hypothetical protein